MTSLFEAPAGPVLPKAPTGIPGLDEITGGGLPRGRSTLLTGGTGCGKTLLGLQFLVAGAREYGEPGVLMTFEESAEKVGGPPLPWTVTTLGSLGTGGTPMVTKYQKFADGYKAEAVKLYRESNQTIAETARNLGLKESTLANWVKKDKDNEAVAVGEAPLTPAERTRIRDLEADVRRLNMENAFLKKASAYFASQNL